MINTCGTGKPIIIKTGSKGFIYEYEQNQRVNNHEETKQISQNSGAASRQSSLEDHLNSLEEEKKEYD